MPGSGDLQEGHRADLKVDLRRSLIARTVCPFTVVVASILAQICQLSHLPAARTLSEIHDPDSLSCVSRMSNLPMVSSGSKADLLLQRRVLSAPLRHNDPMNE